MKLGQGHTYCEATWTKGLSDWIASHVRMLEHLQAAPDILVPDNLLCVDRHYVE